MKNIRFIAVLLFIIATLSAQAQNTKKVTGIVTDEKGEPLIGATVKGQTTSSGSVTDINGNFSININKNEKIISVSYVGYETKIMPIGLGSNLKIILVEQAKELGQLVVIGYGAVKKGSVTAAVANVKADDLKDRPVSNVASALQGELAGVEVRSTSGAPGSGISINVRGAVSINDNASSNPLYVVDGIPMDEDFDLSELNVNDIQSIEVLKDASSSAIYGSRGANGVIIITSKKSDNSGQSSLKFSATFGLQQSERKMNIMTPQEWIVWRTKCNNTRYMNTYASLGATANDDFATRVALTGFNTNYVNDPRWTMPGYGGLALVDWQDEMFRMASYQNYSISTMQGNKKGNYRLSVGYVNQDGLVIETNYKRLNAQFSGETRIKDRITMGLKMAPTVAWTTGGSVDGKDNTAMSALTATPVAESNAGVYTNSQPYDRYLWASGTVSPVATMEQWDKKNEKVGISTSAYIDWDITKGLQVEMLGSWNYNDSKLRQFIPSSLNRYWASYSEGYYSTGLWTGSSSHKLMGQAQLTWNKSWGKHSINTVAGWSLESTSNAYSYNMAATQYPNNAVEGFDILNENVTAATATYNTADRMVSYFARVIYNYDDRYLFNASMRRDGSSRFGSNNRWGTFPAVSAAWRISNEKFWPKNIALTDAKIRMSYGSNGSKSLPVSSANGLLTTINYSTNGTITTGYIPSSLENPDLTWQKTNSWDAAIDFGFLRNRISLSIDSYVKTITDMLYKISLPSDIGFASGYSNIGNIETKGVELELKSNNLSGLLKWATSFNMAYTRSRVKDLGSNSTIYCGFSNSTQVIEVGKSVGEFYLYDAVGVYQTQADLDKYPKQTSSTLGSVRYRDANGDGVIDTNDRMYMGHPSPDFTYGLTNTFRYKNFDFSFLITAQTGGKIYSALGRAFDRQGMGVSSNVLSKYKNMWFSENDPGDGVTPCAWNTSTTEEYDDRWLYSSDFIKLKNITLGYTIPMKRNSFISELRFNASVENVFMIDKYGGGYSPESNNSGSLVSSYDYGAYPLARVYSFGINISF
jgi:Outer membrane cobalamin receptor protein